MRLIPADSMVAPRAAPRVARKATTVVAALAVALTLASPSAWAAWARLGSVAGMAYHYEPASLQRAGSVVAMWVLLDFRAPQHLPGIKPYKSMRMRMEYDCNDDHARRAALSLHGGNLALGEVVLPDADYGVWRAVPPATPAAHFLKVACGRH